MLEFLHSLFSSGVRHQIEERLHKDATRLTHHAGDPPFDLDLDAGTVTLVPAPSAPPGLGA